MVLCPTNRSKKRGSMLKMPDSMFDLILLLKIGKLKFNITETELSSPSRHFDRQKSVNINVDNVEFSIEIFGDDYNTTASNFTIEEYYIYRHSEDGAKAITLNELFNSSDSFSGIREGVEEASLTLIINSINKLKQATDCGYMNVRNHKNIEVSINNSRSAVTAKFIGGNLSIFKERYSLTSFSAAPSSFLSIPSDEVEFIYLIDTGECYIKNKEGKNILLSESLLKHSEDFEAKVKAIFCYNSDVSNPKEVAMHSEDIIVNADETSLSLGVIDRSQQALFRGAKLAVTNVAANKIIQFFTRFAPDLIGDLISTHEGREFAKFICSFAMMLICDKFEQQIDQRFGVGKADQIADIAADVFSLSIYNYVTPKIQEVIDTLIMMASLNLEEDEDVSSMSELTEEENATAPLAAVAT